MTALSAVAAFAACTLNPQPLPPGDDEGNAAADKGASDAGVHTTADAGNAPEARPPAPDGGEALADSGPPEDGGDAGEADASSDAGDDAATDGG